MARRNESRIGAVAGQGAWGVLTGAVRVPGLHDREGGSEQMHLPALRQCAELVAQALAEARNLLEDHDLWIDTGVCILYKND